MKIDPRERLASFSPAYVTEQTVEWLESMSREQAQTLARRLYGESDLRWAADVSMRVRGLGARVEWQRSSELTMGFVLGRWIDGLTADISPERYMLPTPLDASLIDLVASTHESKARLRQLQSLLWDVHGL